jgi:chromosome segregation ATPase
LAFLIKDIVDFKSPFTVSHSNAVMYCAYTLGKILNFGEHELNNLVLSALLHDVGKLTVPTAIIMKNGALTKLEKAFNDFKVKRDSYQKVQRLHSKLVSTQEQYNEERESLARNTKKVTDADTDKLDGYRDEVYNAKRLSSLYNQLDEVLKDAADADVDLTQDVSEVSSQIHKYEDQAIKFESRIESISVKINKSNVQNEKRKMLTEKLHEVTERIEKLNSVIADKEILETLVKVYSSKGIKIQKINSICRLIEKNLNHFKSLLYGVNFKFKIKITEKSFDVIGTASTGQTSPRQKGVIGTPR